VLLIPEFGSAGGTRTFFLTIARYYSESPFEVYVALEDGQIDPGIEKAVRECNLILVRRRAPARTSSFLARFPLNLIRGWLEIRPLIAQLRPHLVTVSVGTLDLWLGLLASGPRTIYFVHSYPEVNTAKPWRNWIKRQVIGRILSRRNALVTVSEFARRRLLDAWTRDGKPADIRVIPNTTRPDMPETARRHPAKPKPITVITLGHIVAYKNPRLWLDVAERVIRAMPTVDVKFLWAGDGPLLEECRSTAKERGLGDNVRFVGLVSDAAEFLDIGDIYFQPSDMESQGISVLEAMRSGLPCVVTAAGGLPETVQDGETGIVVPPGDVAGLASAISALIRDPDLRQRLGSAGRRRYLADYSYSLWESRVRQLHEEMLAASPETGA
jgi:glycosyltransferase involved in cell wall biosynthesis